MIKIVLDTNILISATIWQGNEYNLLKLAKLGKIKLILSPEIIKEFEDVISRPKFGFSKKQIEDAIKHVISVSEIIIPSAKLDAIKDDPSDNKVLEVALAGNVDYLISGDNHLLKLKKFRKVKIINAGRFFELF